MEDVSAITTDRLERSDNLILGVVLAREPARLVSPRTAQAAVYSANLLQHPPLHLEVLRQRSRVLALVVVVFSARINRLAVAYLGPPQALEPAVASSGLQIILVAGSVRAQAIRTMGSATEGASLGNRTTLSNSNQSHFLAVVLPLPPEDSGPVALGSEQAPRIPILAVVCSGTIRRTLLVSHNSNRIKMLSVDLVKLRPRTPLPQHLVASASLSSKSRSQVDFSAVNRAPTREVARSAMRATTISSRVPVAVCSVNPRTIIKPKPIPSSTNQLQQGAFSILLIQTPRIPAEDFSQGLEALTMPTRTSRTKEVDYLEILITNSNSKSLVSSLVISPILEVDCLVI